MKTEPKPELPKDIKASDLKYPDYTDKDKIVRLPGTNNWNGAQAIFELWYTEQMGWCIPTLLIAHANRRSSNTTDRTYATTLDGKQMRIGKGPHVKRTVTVYVRESRLTALQHYLDLRMAGAEVSNQIRDRISSRRAQGQVMRAQGRSSWLWDAK